MAGNTVIKKPYRTMGVSDYTFWELETDDKATGKATYGDAYTLPGTVQITPTDSGGIQVFDADNVAFEIDSYVEKMGHDIENTDVPPQVDKMWRGLNPDDLGVSVDQDTFSKSPHFAVAWKIKSGGGNYRLVKYFKGKYGFASNVGAKTANSEGAPEKQTAKASFTATFRDCDGKGYYYLDTGDLPDSIDKNEVITKWFSEVDYCPTVTTVTPTAPEGE